MSRAGFCPPARENSIHGDREGRRWNETQAGFSRSLFPFPKWSTILLRFDECAPRLLAVIALTGP